MNLIYQKAPPLAGELLSVSEAEGEHLAPLGSFEPFPFRLLIAFAATFPVNGDSFWVQYKQGAQRRAHHPTLTTSAPIFSMNARSCSTISIVGRFFFISSSSCILLSRSM